MLKMPKFISLIRCGFTFILLTAITSTAVGATFYVDFAAGSNSNSGTSASAPWKHCPGDSAATGTAASTTPAAGDTICLKGGVTYNSGNKITLKSSGTSGSRIVYDGNCAGFGNGNKAILNNGTNIYIASKDYNTIKNIEFTGFNDSVIWQDYQQYPDDAIGVTVDNNYIHDGSISQGGAVEFWNSQNTTLSNNTFYRVNYSPYNSGGRGPTYFQCRFSGSSCVGDSTGTTITGNTFSYQGDSPVFCFGQNNLTISYNTIKGPFAQAHSQGITHYNAANGNADIHHNYCDMVRGCLSFEGLSPTTGINVYNNIFNSNNGVSWNIHEWQNTTGTLRIINNVLINSGGDTQSVLVSSSGLATVFRNNIADGYVGSPASVTSSNNVCTKVASGCGSNSIYVSNLTSIFVNTALDSADDYNIISSFAGKEIGYDSSVYGITNDFAGTSRPQGAGWDIGAYELESSGASRQPNPPTMLKIQ